MTLPPAKPFGPSQYFEDFAVGDVFRAAPVEFTAAEIVAFARLYDPQPFHIDKAAAERSQYRGLIASGMQVLALTFRALIDAGFVRGGGMGSPGLDEVRWIKPVRPGDRIVMQVTVLEARASETRPDRGYVTVRFDALNQRGETAMSYRCVEIVKKRAFA
jgi:acyl dehydratase